MRAFLGLGSNLGDRAYYLGEAVSALNRSSITILSKSRVYETEPWGVLDQPPYWNQVIEVETSLSPLDLLHVCQEIEQRLGRVRKEHWGSRTIDIDLLIYDNVVSASKELTLPHPYLEVREFVMAPLREIAPNLLLPSGRPISQVFGEGKVYPL
ncbi:2-amino-4-hydroxy-6-hydroxymethyldihydropteridine pyrophosphokinase [Desulfosporosinus acidiphilus SJ4]|uniref:2-amino-4-hydroxy-6-hydroxymethyldihydropteridine diphosphokinase n=1 Tax=Desulfosporosinus acidiphilus (strain DSM 22704 / JCM 16185 / SJ4) TaxID=646529 RepID=I4D075_DESAJ|nr:2-amino-4-hydroxy-6-hydroxymethyldihydropteridine diphosphokinase [Desulfosporosinus acidiphilus]AFM39199.1 2-amino-4-hydroxy-6-hydroxymethyldihydropteridine pyrophosphokinase [Desulfosporosinus acidiphilus SJ4]